MTRENIILQSKTYHTVGNKAKGRISKLVFQENKARQIFRKTEHFSAPNTHTCLPLCLVTDDTWFKNIIQSKPPIANIPNSGKALNSWQNV